MAKAFLEFPFVTSMLEATPQRIQKTKEMETVTNETLLSDKEFIETIYYILQDHVQDFIRFSNDTLLVGEKVDSYYFDGYTVGDFKRQLRKIGFIPIDSNVLLINL
jgi:hypothetical protein